MLRPEAALVSAGLNRSVSALRHYPGGGRKRCARNWLEMIAAVPYCLYRTVDASPSEQVAQVAALVGPLLGVSKVRGNEMVALEQSEGRWRKSSHSGMNGCVEVAVMPGRVAVRDSKDQGGPVLVFSETEWTAFIRGIKDGEFDSS